MRNYPDNIDNALVLDNMVSRLYDRMFDKYYNGNQLNDWHHITFFGGGNAEWYRNKIRELLENGYRVKTGYRTSKQIRGHKTYYIFYKQTKN